MLSEHYRKAGIMTNKKVVIFGAGGFVGPYLAEEFSSHGYEVFGTDIAEPKSPANSMSSYTVMDMLNPSEVASFIGSTRPDYVVNLAAISSVGDSWRIPQKTIAVNVNGTLNILEAVRKAELHARILLIGSSEEYAVSDSPISEDYELNGGNPYGISKIAQENFAEIYRSSYGLDIVSTRTFNHTGIGQPEKFVLPGFVSQAAKIHNSGKDGKIYVGNLSVRRDFGDVRDMVSAYRMLLESDTHSKVFNVGSGVCLSLAELLDYIVSLAAQRIEVIVSPEKLRPIDNPVIWCDNSLLRAETGWTSRYTIYDTIREMFSAMTGENML